MDNYTYVPEFVAEQWGQWCGENQWVKAMKSLANTGTKIIWYCGFPQSASAIPLCFVIVLPNGMEINGSRLKDIRNAIKLLKNRQGINPFAESSAM